MRAHYLQHVPFEGLGSIESWLVSSGYEVTCSALYEPCEFPSVEEVDFLIIMGGPMNIYEYDQYPWLVEEKAFIKAVIQAGKPVLGVCLGAQLIADTMGGEVISHPVKEIGWFPITAEPSTDVVFKFPVKLEVFHWHAETVKLPEGAVHIARSAGCKNQAFQLGGNVIGLQFHLETTPAAVKDIVKHCGHEIEDGPFVQSAEDILNASADKYRVVNLQMSQLLEYLTR